jgi:hypothetical protein
MTLEEYLTVIAASVPRDWRATQVPTFMHRIVPVRNPGSSGADFEIQEHNVLLSFTKDIRFSMAFGLVVDKNYNEDWIDRLPNKKAEGVLVDFLFSGALVFRDMLVAVDGWRCILPQPLGSEGPPYKVPERRFRIAKLVHQLCGPETNFEAYFKRVGMAPVTTPWP